MPLHNEIENYVLLFSVTAFNLSDWIKSIYLKKIYWHLI